MPAITDEQRDRVLRLARDGKLGRNEIAKAVGVSAGSVTNITKAAGVSFDRTATELAVKSRKIDLAARRTELQGQLLEDAAKLRELLWAPHTYRELGKFSWEGGSESRFVEYDQDTPTPTDQLKLMQAATVAISTELRMAQAAGDGDNDQAKSMLVQLAAMLDGEWRELQAADQ